MNTTLSVSEARASLAEILERVRDGEEITLTRHGEPIAVVVRPDTLRARRADRALAAAAEIHDAIESARHRPLSEHGTLSAARAEELLEEIRADRSAR